MGAIPLSTWAMLAEIIGGFSIVTGLIVGWFQIRHHRSQQRNAVAINLAQTFYNRDFAQAVVRMQHVPDNVSLKELRAMGREHEDAAITVCTSFETMGLLVYKRIAELDLVLDLAGGIVAVMRRKLDQWLVDVREEQAQTSWAEWFNWLGDRALERKEQSPPAHLAYKNLR